MHCPNCRAALPTGSRFCNHCGNSIAAAAPPVGDRTQAMPPQQHQTQYGQAHHGQQPYGQQTAYNQPAYAPPSSHLPPPLPAARKPVWPWAAAAAAALVTLATAGMLYANSRKGSVLSSGLDAPSAPAVIQAPRSEPKAPAITQAPNTVKPGAPVVQAPVPATDNTAFEKYLSWLKYAEQEREIVNNKASARQQKEIKEFYDLVLQMGGDPGPEVDQQMMAYPDKQMNSFQEVVNAQAVFWQNIIRTKPAVPEDCKYLDFYYTEAGRISVALAEEAGRAAQAKNMGALQGALRKNALVDSNLKNANRELSQIKAQRRLRDDWMIAGLSGGGSGLMPGIGLPGM